MVISNHNSFGCCLIKLLPYILFEKYINILALEITSPGNRHCANSIGTLLFPILKQFSVHCVKSVKTLNSRREQWLWRAGGSDLIRALLLLNFLLEDYHSERSAGEQRAVARVTKHEWEQKRKWDDRIRRCTTNDNSPQQLLFSYEKIVDTTLNNTPALSAGGFSS